MTRWRSSYGVSFVLVGGLSSKAGVDMVRANLGNFGCNIDADGASHEPLLCITRELVRPV